MLTESNLRYCKYDPNSVNAILKKLSFYDNLFFLKRIYNLSPSFFFYVKIIWVWTLVIHVEDWRENGVVSVGKRLVATLLLRPGPPSTARTAQYGQFGLNHNDIVNRLVSQFQEFANYFINFLIKVGFFVNRNKYGVQIDFNLYSIYMFIC